MVVSVPRDQVFKRIVTMLHTDAGLNEVSLRSHDLFLAKPACLFRALPSPLLNASVLPSIPSPQVLCVLLQLCALWESQHNFPPIEKSRTSRFPIFSLRAGLAARSEFRSKALLFQSHKREKECKAGVLIQPRTWDYNERTIKVCLSFLHGNIY